MFPIKLVGAHYLTTNQKKRADDVISNKNGATNQIIEFCNKEFKNKTVWVCA
jgi:hypothetical protein